MLLPSHITLIARIAAAGSPTGAPPSIRPVRATARSPPRPAAARRRPRSERCNQLLRTWHHAPQVVHDVCVLLGEAGQGPLVLAAKLRAAAGGTRLWVSRRACPACCSSGPSPLLGPAHLTGANNSRLHALLHRCYWGAAEHTCMQALLHHWPRCSWRFAPPMDASTAAAPTVIRQVPASLLSALTMSACGLSMAS
jgi:hypothetical protein